MKKPPTQGHFFTWMLCIFLSSLPFSGQTQDLVIVTLPMINSYDCVEALELYTATLKNTTNIDLNVYIEVEVLYTESGANHELLARGRTSTFTLNAMSVLIITPHNAETIFGPIEYEILNNSMENTYFRTGCLIPGSYEVCLKVLDATTPNELLLGIGCQPFNIISNTPLILVNPYHESEIAFQLPLFTWTPQPNLLTTGSHYRIKIVEILDPQTPYAAFQSNPVFFEEKGLFTNVFQYPVSARPFEPCRDYAWMVNYESMTGGIITSSEIWSFRTTCEKEKKKREDQNDPPEGNRIYFSLSTTDAGNYNQVTDGNLRFSFDHALQPLDQLSYSILDSKGKNVTPSAIPLNESFTLETMGEELGPVVQTGDNQFVLPLENAGLKENEYYTFRLEGLKFLYYLRFILKTNLD